MSENMENNYELKGAIVKAIAFFDMFDFPLTAMEAWRNLNMPGGLAEVMAALEEAADKSPQTSPHPLPSSTAGRLIKERGLGGNIEYKNGFYFLAGRGAIAEERLGRYNFVDRKFKRAIAAARFYKFIPWIKMIAVGNLMGAHNLKDSSDIDLFIITETKRIWLARFFCVFLAKILGWRPKPGNIKDKICLSFFVSDKAMELRSLMISASPGAEFKGFLADARNDKEEIEDDKEEADIYFIYWLANLTPIYDRGGVYEKFMAANSWLKNYLPNWPAYAFAVAKAPASKPAREQPGFWSKRRDAGSPWPIFYRDVVDLFFGGLEPWFKKLQVKLLPENLKKMMNLDTRVVVNDSVLKLHINDRREYYNNNCIRKIKELI